METKLQLLQMGQEDDVTLLKEQKEARLFFSS